MATLTSSNIDVKSQNLEGWFGPARWLPGPRLLGLPWVRSQTPRALQWSQLTLAASQAPEPLSTGFLYKTRLS